MSKQKIDTSIKDTKYRVRTRAQQTTCRYLNDNYQKRLIDNARNDLRKAGLL